MTPRDLHDGRTDGLTPLQSLDLGEVESFAGLVRAMKATAFGGRQLGEALDIFLEMSRGTECLVVMTLSGAMTVAKQGTIICEMLDRGLIDVIVTTGALIAHGLTESIGLVHYAVNPEADDTALFRKGYNRIYDTVEMEANLNEVSDVFSNVLSKCEKSAGAWSSSGLCRAVGEHMDHLAQGPGILRSAYRQGVPVFIPAFTDSEIGLDFATCAMVRAFAHRGHVERDLELKPGEVFEAVPRFNPFLDLQEYARVVSQAKNLGIFTVGGGVPRNWAQQIGPYSEMTAERLKIKLRVPRFRYGIRICPEPVHWGGLSGCTYSEGVSWGKFLPIEEGGRFAEVHADATLVWPLLMKAVFEELDRD
jgi:deoxyhypusine synthase